MTLALREGSIVGRNENPEIIVIAMDATGEFKALGTAGNWYLRGRLPGYRANEFRERSRGLGIEGVSLHSYRYAWAERAKTAGDPERFAQLALRHNSKAVHRAYARKAQVTLPPLEDYEKNAMTAPVIPLPVSSTG